MIWKLKVRKIQFSSFQSHSRVWLFATPWTAACLASCGSWGHKESDMIERLNWTGLQHDRLPCPSPAPRAYPNSCPLSRWCHPTISSSVVPFSSCFQSSPATSQSWLSPAHSPSMAPISFLVTPATFPWLRGPCLVSPCWCLISSVSLCLQPLHCSSNVPDPVPLQGICLDFPSPDPRMTPSLILQVFKLSPIPHCPSLPGFFSSPVSLLSDGTFPWWGCIFFLVLGWFCFLHRTVSSKRGVIWAHFVNDCVLSAQHRVWHRSLCVEWMKEWCCRYLGITGTTFPGTGSWLTLPDPLCLWASPCSSEPQGGWTPPSQSSFPCGGTSMYLCSDTPPLLPRTQQGKSGTGPSRQPTTGAPWASSSCTTSPTRSPSMLCRTGTWAPTRPLLSQASCKAWGTGRDERSQPLARNVNNNIGVPAML